MDDVYVFAPQESEKSKELLARWSYYTSRQHDHLSSNWDGMARTPGVEYLRERFHAAGYAVGRDDIPAANRKPDVAIPLGSQIISRFTGMLVGDRCSPQVVSIGDDDTTAYLADVVKHGMFDAAFDDARNVAGACGCALIAFGLIDGKPAAEALKPFNVIVLAWARTRQSWQPADVIEQRLVEVQRIADGKIVTENEWETRRWNQSVVVRYKNVPEKWAADQPIPMDGSPVYHGLKRCPVVWYQNLRDTESAYSQSDLDGTYHLLDRIDRLESQTVKATARNVDPTLHVADIRQTRFPFIKKGSEGLIRTSEQGTAKYVEISGDSIDAGIKKKTDLQRQVENKTECVIIDPETGSWAYRSGEALQVLYRSMQSRAGRLRTTLSLAWIEAAQMYIDLFASVKIPPRAVIGVTGDGGENAEQVKRQPHKLGSSDPVLDVIWPPFWTPTASQLRQIVHAFSTATGAGKILSSRTATEELCRQIGADPVAELSRIATEEDAAAESAQEQLENMAGVGQHNPPDEDEIVDEEDTPEQKKAEKRKDKLPPSESPDEEDDIDAEGGD